MKTLDWQNFFAEQKDLHGKVVFSVAELANAARTTLHALNTELGRLMARGVVARYAQGRYGPRRGVEAEDVVQAIDPSAYITGFYALFRHGLVTQAPVEITCFTNRRHNRRPDRMNSTVRLNFICVPAGRYAKLADQVVASGERALCDFVWLNLRQGIDPRSLVAFQNLDRLKRRRLNKILETYPEPVRSLVGRITRVAQREMAPPSRDKLRCPAQARGQGLQIRIHRISAPAPTGGLKR